MSGDDLKKLLELASKTTSKEEVKTYKSTPEIVRFINELNILQGEAKVPNSKIYFIYCKWNPKRTRLKPIAFFKIFKKSFRSYIETNERGYRLDPRPFVLSEEDQRIYDEQQKERDIRNQKKRTRLFMQKYRAQQEEKKKQRQS